MGQLPPLTVPYDAIFHRTLHTQRVTIPSLLAPAMGGSALRMGKYLIDPTDETTCWITCWLEVNQAQNL